MLQGPKHTLEVDAVIVSVDTRCRFNVETTSCVYESYSLFWKSIESKWWLILYFFKLTCQWLIHCEPIFHFYIPLKMSVNLWFQDSSAVQLPQLYFLLLSHFSPVWHFYTPWKCQKTKSFLTFSGGIEIWHWTKMG